MALNFSPSQLQGFTAAPAAASGLPDRVGLGVALLSFDLCLSLSTAPWRDGGRFTFTLDETFVIHVD